MTPVPHRRFIFRLVALAGLVAAGWLAACRPSNPVIVPNRVLDRPLDVVLVCIEHTADGDVELRDLSVCEALGTPSCDDVDTPLLIGFVSNTERNEVGMFRRCDQNGMVDLDPEASGYNLVPVGTQPNRIVRSDDCRIVTANVGSCDLSAVELQPLAAFSVGVDPGVAPSALVTTIRPRRGDGTLLGATPGDLLAVPRELSLSQGIVGGSDGEAGAVCDPDGAASVYVTFPTCQLVAEIDLGSQRILQSRQFVTDADGVVSVIDPGPDPQCPLECADQFDTIPTDRPPGDPDGVFPVALALVRGSESLTQTASLYVGGTGSDEVFQIDIESVAGTNSAVVFAPPEETKRLLLESPAGLQNIRVTPRMNIQDGLAENPDDQNQDVSKLEDQFLYIVAGDGSTHVVKLANDDATVGVECDTQVDPALATSRACHEIDPGSQASANDRRPFAAGPGIRGPDGSTITDWAFQFDPGTTEAGRGPFESEEGIVGFGVTSFGRVVVVVFGQYEDAAPTISQVDPLGLMNVEIRPHMLWPVVDPASGDPSVFPLVSDEEPRRVLPSEDNPMQVLAPALRRIDLAYTDDLTGDTDGDAEVSAEQAAIAEHLGFPQNVDELGDPNGDAFYETPVARMAVRDYRQWRGNQTWRLLWEGQIPATESATGRIDCDTPNPNTLPGHEAGTCVAVGDGPRLVDEGATFCNEGVLPGDKLVLFGCGDDDECGIGRRCLRDPSSGGATSGICVSSLAYDNDLEGLREACAPFISDPCGSPRREYVITSATQTELTFAAIDIAPTTFPRDVCPVAAGRDNLRDPGGPKPVPPEPPPPPDPEDPPPLLQECEARLTCAMPEGVDAPAGGCATDDECDELGTSIGATYVCIEGVCRTPCEGGSLNCRQMVLPGPGCFAEFVRYAITVRESFLVAVEPQAPFIADRVLADPETGQCREDPTASNLLTSRLALGIDEDATFEDIPDCPPSESASPSDPNPCRILTPRGDGREVYHYFSYDEVPVSAVRFSNPFGTFVLDLVSLLDLAAPSDALLADGVTEKAAWPPGFETFRRARIPRNYREEFATPSVIGYQTFNDPIVVSNTPLTYPVRIIPAPEPNAAYIVDSSGRGGLSGVRGQVVRITISASEIRGDEKFRVR